MSAVPALDDRTRYSSHRQDDVDGQAWPEFGEEARRLLDSAGQVIKAEPAELPPT